MKVPLPLSTPPQAIGAGAVVGAVVGKVVALVCGAVVGFVVVAVVDTGEKSSVGRAQRTKIVFFLSLNMQICGVPALRERCLPN